MSAGSEQEQADDLRIFISYRRSDCQAQANGLNDGLRHRLPTASVFMDIDSIPFGVDFEQHIREEIRSCHVVLVLIGDNWLEPIDKSGARRIDDQQDFVRLEIESALASPQVRVVPVLVEDAPMPSFGELPKNIQRLARLNAIELNDRRWQADLRRLAAVVEDIGREPRRPVTPPPPATIRLDQLDMVALADALLAMPTTFQTKDVSEHASAAHGPAASARNYHAMVGSYIARNRAALHVRSQGKASNGRGERWERIPAQPPEPKSSAGPLAVSLAPPHPHSLPPSPTQAPDVRQWGQQAAPRQTAPTSTGGGSAAIGWLMVVLPLATMGLAAWVPPFWAALKRDDDPRVRRILFTTAAACVVVVLTGFVLVGSSESSSEGTPTGPSSNIGTAMILAVIGVGLWAAIAQRNAGRNAAMRRKGSASAFQQALAARQTREHYRRLAGQDPGLARESLLGRPDRLRQYYDGGLLDLNSLTAEALERFAQLSSAQAQQLVATRERFGRLGSVDELVVHADLDPVAADRLREHAIFL